VVSVEGPGVDVSISESLDAAGAAALFGTLSDPTRLRLLAALAEGECGVGRLVERLGLPQPTVSHHLGLLKLAKLVADKRTGKRVSYRLGGNALRTATSNDRRDGITSRLTDLPD